jgi:hypothetical protein
VIEPGPQRRHLIPGIECDSTLLSNVPRRSARFYSADPLVKSGFDVKIGMDFWRQGRDTDRGDRSTG